MTVAESAVSHVAATTTPPVEAPSPPTVSVYSVVIRRLLRGLGSVTMSVVVILVLWEGFLLAYHIQPIIAKSPLDVWRYLFTQRASEAHGLRSAAANRSVLFHNLGVTLTDAAIGYVSGFILALVVACTFVLQRTVRQTFMPVALMLRAVPLVAMAPLITLIFGRGLLAVAVIGGLVCFFPALVNMAYGLQSTAATRVDLIVAFGGSRLTLLRKVQIPSALPSIFASLRINVPASVVGALLAEWLATGKGSGQEMLTVQNTFDYGELWSAVVLVTLVSVVMYSLVSAVEAGILSRYAPDALAHR